MRNNFLALSRLASAVAGSTGGWGFGGGVECFGLVVAGVAVCVVGLFIGQHRYESDFFEFTETWPKLVLQFAVVVVPAKANMFACK